MARAPLLLSESLLFPYREGLSFEQDVWMDQGQAAAFAGALDRPPTSSWEIINPRDVRAEAASRPIPLLPDIHPLVDPLYRPYDIGQIGELDVHIITELFGGDACGARSDSGLGWRPLLGRPTAQRHHARRAGQHQIAGTFLSLGLEERRFSADLRQALRQQSWAEIFQRSKRLGLQQPPSGDGSVEQVFSTNEGPVVITTRGKMVFVAESFPLPLARKLTALILDAQGGGGAMRMTSLPVWPGTRFFEPPSDSWAVDSAAIAHPFRPYQRKGSDRPRLAVHFPAISSAFSGIAA